MIRHFGLRFIWYSAAGMCLLPAAAPSQNVSGLSVSRIAAVSQPLFVTAPSGDFNRIFIATRTGQISIFNLATGTLNSTAFLNIQSRISTTGEQGLLGMSFDPNFANNGKFYLNFLVPGGSLNNGKTR